MIDIDLLEKLVAFKEYGTLSETANQLHISQPALTRSMKKLEDELQVSLFNRTKNHLTFTKLGEKTVEYAKDVLLEHHRFEEKVHIYDRSLHTIQIGYCAPVPQSCLTSILNNVFEGMTISSEMKDDTDFLQKLENHEFQLAVVHEKPVDPKFYVKKCGYEDLYINLSPSHPLTFYPEIYLKDLDGQSILLFTQIGFWMNSCKNKMPHSHFLLQIERDSFEELAQVSEFPVFSSSYYRSARNRISNRIEIPIIDSECHTFYYLVCLKSEYERYKRLFEVINENTIA